MTACAVSEPVSVEASRCVTDAGSVQVRAAVDRSPQNDTIQSPAFAVIAGVVWLALAVSRRLCVNGRPVSPCRRRSSRRGRPTRDWPRWCELHRRARRQPRRASSTTPWSPASSWRSVPTLVHPVTPVGPAHDAVEVWVRNSRAILPARAAVGTVTFLLVVLPPPALAAATNWIPPSMTARPSGWSCSSRRDRR